MNARNDTGGFTLIERILAISLLAIGAISIFHSAFSYQDLSEMAHERNIAYFDLETVLEDIRSTPFDQIVDKYPDGATVPKFNGLHLNREQVTIEYRNPNRDPLIITATIRWRDNKGHPREESMFTARTR